MDEALDQVADGFVPRGLEPHWYLLIYLPSGLAGGFVTVTMGFLLAHHGVSVAAVAALLVLYGLPTTWKFAMGPVLDTSLSPPKWYLINLAIAVAALIALAFAPLSMSSMPLLSGMALLMGVAMNAMTSSATAGMALTTPNEQRGAVAGWLQCGQLGGSGLGGGLGLWLAEHAGGQATAAVVLAGLCALCALPIFHLRVPPRLAGLSVRHRLLDVVGALWTLARTRTGVLAILANVLPASLGAATALLPAVAGDWRASADMVALDGGRQPARLRPGRLSLRHLPATDHLHPVRPRLRLGRSGHGPRTPHAHVVRHLLRSERRPPRAVLGRGGRRCLRAIGRARRRHRRRCAEQHFQPSGGGHGGGRRSAQAKRGSTGMLLIEAGFGAASVVVYVLIASVWKPAPKVALQPVAAIA